MAWNGIGISFRLFSFGGSVFFGVHLAGDKIRNLLRQLRFFLSLLELSLEACALRSGEVCILLGLLQFALGFFQLVLELGALGRGEFHILLSLLQLILGLL